MDEYGVFQGLSVNPALCRLKLSPLFASDRPYRQNKVRV
jgi:hypothetical protein